MYLILAYTFQMYMDIHIYMFNVYIRYIFICVCIYFWGLYHVPDFFFTIMF